MDFEKKRVAALKFLASTGIRPIHYAPLLFQFLWRVGIKVPPPHFADFTTNFVIRSLGCWAFLSLFLVGMIAWSGDLGNTAVLSMLLAFAAGIGLAMGFIMSIYYYYSARKHFIPPWPDF